MQTKIVPEFVYEGLGFPVVLHNVPLVNVQGVWAPRINYQSLQKQVLLALSKLPFPLTGNEIAFIRNYCRMTLQAFGNALGVRHSAVIKWESRGDESAKISATTELCIRLFILERLNASDDLFRSVFRDFNMEKLTQAPAPQPTLSFDTSPPHEACG